MKKDSQKFLCLMMVIILVLLCLVGCSQTTSTEATSSADEQNTIDSSGNNIQTGGIRNDFVYCLTSDVATLDPTKSTDQISNIVWRQIYDTLARRNTDGSYEPRIATDWEMSDDGLTYTFHLRDDVVFHDGTPLTADDVAYCINSYITAPVTAGQMVNMEEGAAVAVDDYTLQVNLTAPYGAIYDLLFVRCYIFSKESHQGDNFEYAPAGTGPYKLVSRTSGESVVVEAFDQYYMEQPAIKNITFRIIMDSTSQIAALQKGEVDFLTHAPLTAKDTVLADENLVWNETALRGNVWIVMNHNNPYFSNINVRKAIQVGVSKENMLIGGSNNMGTIAESMFPPSITASIESLYTAPYSYDLELAKQYMAEAGYPDGFSDVSILTCETPLYYDAAVTLQGELANLGINAPVNQIDRTVFFTEIFNRNYDIAIMHTTMPVPDADFIYQLAHSSTGKVVGSQNYIPIINSEVDRWLEQGRTALTLEERQEAYLEFQKIADEEVYWVPLYCPNCAVVYREGLQGFEPDDLYTYYVYDWSW